MEGEDARFTGVRSNPIYRALPASSKKVNIDSRFTSMFTGDQFKVKYKVDKRGRPVHTTTDDNLKKYYNLVEESPEIKEEEESEEWSEEEVKIEEGGSSKLSAEVRQKLRDPDVDYARGEGAFVTQESSDEDSDESSPQDHLEHEWGEMDGEAERTEEATPRLALCNMDWDRLKALDLMVLFTSFLPSGGILKAISIYRSEFGKERMAEEELQGPAELKQFKKETDSEGEEEGEEGDSEDEGNAYHREKLRKYQLNRLKYFYAVLEFDSAETAEAVYTECDGREYESSAAKIDLRFIPNDMTFDEKPTDRCDRLPEAGKYRPKFFTTTALQQVKVECTWDETDPSRKDTMDRLFNSKEEVEDEDLKAYLASDSDDEEDQPTHQPPQDGGDGEDGIGKYRALLSSLHQTEAKKAGEVELEVTWGLGLKKKTEDLVKKKLRESEGPATPWEDHLAKLKAKRAARRASKRAGDEDQPFSDDDVDVDMDDPFFQNELKTNHLFTAPANKSKRAPKDHQTDDFKSNGELELLVMEEEEGKAHFNLKNILEGESKSKRKRRAKHAPPSEVKEDFEVDVGDSRFRALFTSPHFNIDPSDPNFKRTKAMEVILTEKQKRRAVHTNDVRHSQQSATKKAELKYLVNSIRRNTINQRKAKQRPKT